MPATEQLHERIDSLNVNEKDGKITPDYVYVDKNMETPQNETLPEYSPCSETLSISKTEEWKELLLQDPKVDVSQ